MIKKDSECSKQKSQPPSHCQWEENENPIILVNQASTAALVEKTINEWNNFLSPPIFGERKKKQLVLKLNGLKDTNARYESHKDFLLNCIQAELIPKGLKPDLEPIIENQNWKILDNWCTKPKDLLAILMKDIVEYCDHTIKETGALTNCTEELLKKI